MAFSSFPGSAQSWFVCGANVQPAIHVKWRSEDILLAFANEGWVCSWLSYKKSFFSWLHFWLSLLWKCFLEKFVQETYLNKMFPGVHAVLPSRHGRCVCWYSWAPAPILAAGSLEVLSPFASGTLLRVHRFSQPEAVTRFGLNQEESVSPWIAGRVFQDWGCWSSLGCSRNISNQACFHWNV